MKSVAGCFALVVLALAGPAMAAEYLVRCDGTGDFPTIQAAIGGASNGDIIQLEDGTYLGPGNRGLDYGGKSIIVRSRSGNPAACIIDCRGDANSPHRGFFFHSGEGNGSVLHGITISGGLVSGPAPDGDGGGIYICARSSPKIENVMLTGNRATNGGGLCCTEWSEALLMNITLEGNVATEHGGGLVCEGYSSPTLLNVSVFRNSAGGQGGGIQCTGWSCPTITNVIVGENSALWGGGMMCWQGSSPCLLGATFFNNTASLGAGGLACNLGSSPFLVDATFSGNRSGSCCDNGTIHCDNNSSPRIESSIVAFGEQGPAITCSSGSQPLLSCCDVYGNANGSWVGCIADQFGLGGNFSADPMFSDAANGRFTLRADSPCAPPSDPTCGQIGAWPVEGGVGEMPPSTCREGATTIRNTTWGRLKTTYR